jgi:hypothetical protein
VGARAQPRPNVNVQHVEVQTQPVDNGSEGGSQVTPSDRAAQCENQDARQPLVVPEEVQALVGLLKQRLAELDVDLARLRQENELLRAERATPTPAVVPKGGCEDHGQIRELEHLLHDRVRQMKILEEQFAHLQHKAKTKTLLYRENLDKVEKLTSELFDAKQTLLQQAEWLHAQEDANAQLRLLEKEVHVLRSENATLNETVGVLSARPLDALNLQLEERALQLSLLEERNATLEKELEKATQDHRVVVETNDKLRARVETLTRQLENPFLEIQKLKAEREQLIGEREIAEMRLQFYLSGESTESKELMDAVGQALKQMRIAKDCLRHGEPTPAMRENEEVNAGHAFRLERAEKTAQVTKAILDETCAQLQDQKIAHHAEVRELKRKCVHWQQRANEYLREITSLTQNEDMVVVRSPLPPKLRRFPTSTHEPINTTTRSRDPHIHIEETLMEVRLYDLCFTAGIRPPDRSSYVMFCDYFDFEPQHSPIFTLDSDSPTSVAPMEMEVSYKLLVDQAFCRSRIAQSLTLELHRLRVASASVVAATDVSLQSLFLSDNGYLALSAKLRDPTTRATVGTVRVALTLSRPVEQLFRAWCQADTTRIRLLPRPSPSDSVATIRASLQLSICMVAIVFTKETGPSTAYTTVRYRFMGNAPVRYSTQSAPRESYGYSVCSIDRVRTFEVPSDDSIVAFLERHEMMLEIESPGGVRGQANVSFQSAVRGFRTHSCGSAIISAVVSSVDHPSDQARQLGRMWIDLQAIDAKAVETIQAKVLRGPATRVFSCVDSTQIDWHRFCQVMTLSSSERVVRQLMLEKLQTAGGIEVKAQMVKLLDEASRGTGDGLSSFFQRVNLPFSRSELSLLDSSLFTNDRSDPQDDASGSNHHGFLRLKLLAETLDKQWLHLEPLLRLHVEMRGVLVAYPQTEKTEWIPWDTFVLRIRLLK